jgi:alkylation response protein AidB-like acyl-CoA dehydrogenase
MPEFLQAPPTSRNRFRTDPALRFGLERHLPADMFAAIAPVFDNFAERCVREIAVLADRAELHPPRHVPFDAWGRRIDRIDMEAAFDGLVRIGQEEGLVSLAHDSATGPHGRVIQAGLINLFDPVSAAATCPLAMTDAAATLLRRHDSGLWQRYGQRLTARRDAITAGQWMTETAGGSDVSLVATRAVPDPDGTYRLYGTKWFTSATSADIALVLARPDGAQPGSAGLSLFLLELRRPDGSWNAIRVRRLKDKMGTRAMPTAELDLEGAVAVPVGGVGAGVAKLASMLNVARVWAAYAAPAAVGHLLDLARDYAFRRQVFGAPLAQLPMHRAWLARIAAEYEAMIALCFETASLLGQADDMSAPGLARLMAPLAKFACTRGGISGASELIESFGGAGYLEDTGLPRVFRNAHVHTIWEGTSSVMAQDVLRALRSQAVAQAWLDDIARRLAGTVNQELAWVKPRIEAALEMLRPMVLAPDEREGRRLAAGMARVTEAAVLTEAAAWRIDMKSDRSALVAVEILTRHSLVPPETADMDIFGLAFGRPDIPPAAPAP